MAETIATRLRTLEREVKRLRKRVAALEGRTEDLNRTRHPEDQWR